MSMPEIDVIIAVFNGEKYIREAIQSVQEQTWNNLNILVCDDGSTDSTVPLVQEMAELDTRITLWQYPHRGVAATLNSGLAHSTAPLISFLDADDLWTADKLVKQVQELQYRNTNICFSWMEEFETFSPTEERMHRARPEALKGYSKSTLLAKREVFDTYGYFDESIAIGDFVDWYSRVLRAGETISMLSDVLALRRVHNANTTRFVAKNSFLSLIKSHLDEKRKAE